jgi:hypothetical protein
MAPLESHLFYGVDLGYHALTAVTGELARGSITQGHFSAGAEVFAPGPGKSGFTASYLA